MQRDIKVGDLVKLKCPTTTDFKNVFLVAEWHLYWIKVLGQDGWKHKKDFEVISESR